MWPFGLADALEDSRDALTDADAHRCDAVASAAAVHLVHERRGHARARAADGMAERDRAAVDVHAGGVEAELADAGERLGGERLVELDEVDVGDAQAGAV